MIETAILIRVLHNKDDTEEKRQAVVSKNREAEVLGEIHSWASGAHFVEANTLEKFRVRFYWVNYKEKTRIGAKMCSLCSHQWTAKTSEVTYSSVQRWEST